MTTRKEALTDLLAKVEAGVKYETMGHTVMCQKAFPKPDDFDGSREAYAKSAAQMAVLVWRNGSLDAAKALHEAVLPGWGWELLCGGHAILRRYSMKIQAKPPHDSDPARAWLIATLKALIAQETEV